METRVWNKKYFEFYMFSKLSKNTKVTTKSVQWFSYDRIPGKDTNKREIIFFIYLLHIQAMHTKNN